MISPESQQINNVIAEKKPKNDIPSRGKMDMTFFGMVMLLLTVGLVMLFSASYAYAYYYYNGNSYKFITNQAIFAVVGVAAMIIISFIDYRCLKKFHLPWIVYGISVALLAVVLILPPMNEELGVKRWISFGSFNFQPSEIAKFAIILLFSYLIAQKKEKMKTFKDGILPFVILLGLVCLLLIKEPHLSATVLVFFIGAVLMIVGGIRLKWLAVGGGAAVAGFILVIATGVVSYASKRIDVWFNPWSDPQGDGFQTIQSIYAIGSGGLWGRGIGQSRQKYLWVPEPHNDFIFSIVCEELGLIGAVAILAAFCVLVWRGISIARRAPDRFGGLLALGITFQVGLQAALNVLVVTDTIPNTGISLPFFSYGGTALLMLLAQMGIMLSISRQSSVKKRVEKK